MGGAIFLIVIIVIVAWVLASCIRIVPQAYAVILEGLGAYQATWSTGIHFKVPFIERVARKVNLKEQVVDFPPQPVITKDNVTMQIDTVVFFQITDPKLYTYGVENPIMAIENLSATTLRNIIGDMELEESTGRTYSRIHVVGGGSNAGYLNELTAKATGKEVHAGPGEATAIGNITAQMLKAGDFKSVEEARTTIHESFGIKIYK